MQTGAPLSQGIGYCSARPAGALAGRRERQGADRPYSCIGAGHALRLKWIGAGRSHRRMVQSARHGRHKLRDDQVRHCPAMGSLCAGTLSLMPRGTRHELTGILLEGDFYPVLRVADGGEWRLEITKAWRPLLGKRVAIIGVRDGFDLIAVERITLA